MNKTSANLMYIAAVFRVADLSRWLAFYRDQLGFRVDFVYEGFYVGVCRDNCRIHFDARRHKRCGRPGGQQG
jgi:catechol 2,3-dioxygenase-like lactoylglutathione lyase family enzyme